MEKDKQCKTHCPCPEAGEYCLPSVMDGKRHIRCAIEDGYVPDDTIECIHQADLNQFRRDHPISRSIDEDGRITIIIQPDVEAKSIPSSAISGLNCDKCKPLKQYSTYPCTFCIRRKIYKDYYSESGEERHKLRE